MKRVFLGLATLATLGGTTALAAAGAQAQQLQLHHLRQTHHAPAAAAAGMMGSGVELGIMGGAVFPTSHLSEEFKTGYTVGRALGFNPTMLPFGVRLEGDYDVLSGKSIDGFDIEDAKLWRGSLNAMLKMPGSMISPFATVGAGFYHQSAYGSSDTPAGRRAYRAADEDDEAFTKFGIPVGAGLNFHLAGMSTMVEGLYHIIFTEGEKSKYVTARVGLMFDIGGSASAGRR